MEYHSWQKQERFKGRFGVDAWLGNAGTSEMGWGFSNTGFWEDGEPPMYDDSIGLGALFGIPARLSEYTVLQVADATDEQLVADPVFRHSPESVLIGGNQTRAELDCLLARGVPALSGPVGSRIIRSVPTSRTKNLNERTSEITWPRANASRWNGWRHGDIRAIALPHVFSVFAEIVQLTDNNQ